MIAAPKHLQFKQKDSTNQTYMHGGTQRKKWVEVLKEKMQMYNAGTEREFFRLWKTDCKYQKVVQLWSSTQPLSLQHTPPHTFQKMEGGAGILKTV